MKPSNKLQKIDIYGDPVDERHGQLFTTRCTLVQSAVYCDRMSLVCPSVSPSV